MRRKFHRKKNRRAKLRLGLPDQDQSKSAVLGSLRSPESQRGYRHAIDEFVEWYCSEPRLSLNRTVVMRYRNHLESRSLAPGLSIILRADNAAIPGFLNEIPLLSLVRVAAYRHVENTVDTGDAVRLPHPVVRILKLGQFPERLHGINGLRLKIGRHFSTQSMDSHITVTRTVKTISIIGHHI